MDTSHFENAMSFIKALPQSAYIPETRLRMWLNKVINLDDGKSLNFHVSRLGGIGGSECGAILAHYHDSASAVKLEDGFKSADDISREKLLLATPFTTPYAERGTKAEPVIRDIFCRKYNLFGSEDHEAIQAVRTHATNPYMSSNADDIFFNKKRILVDYKSTSARSYTGSVPFSHASQINHYNENLRSNNYAADICLTANLVAEESVFADIIQAYEKREQFPDDYEFWVKAVLSERLSSCKLIIKEVASTQEFGQMIGETVKRFMEEYPLRGKTISSNFDKTALIGQERVRAAEIESKIFHLLSAEKVLSQLKESYFPEINEFSKGVGQPFDWPNYFPISIAQKQSLNTQAALEAVELSGFDVNRLYVPSASDDYDTNKIIEKFISIGGELEESFLKRKLDTGRLEQALDEVGLDKKDFFQDESPYIRMSRRVSNLDQKEALNIELTEAMQDLIEAKAIDEIAQIEELHDEHSLKSNDNLNFSN